jgi:hypothetical protein
MIAYQVKVSSIRLTETQSKWFNAGYTVVYKYNEHYINHGRRREGKIRGGRNRPVAEGGLGGQCPPLGNKIEIMPPPLIPHFLPFKKNRQRGCHIQANKVNIGVA